MGEREQSSKPAAGFGRRADDVAQAEGISAAEVADRVYLGAAERRKEGER